ncbi:DNRLRE domain-containing protein [Sorangium sp. So ce429]
MKRNRRIKGWCVLLGQLSLVAFAAPAAADDPVVLHPGTLDGTVSFEGLTMSSGYIYAYSSDGLEASSSFTGNSFSLTMEGGHAYRRRLYATLTSGVAPTTIRVERTNALDIQAGSAQREDFTYAMASISGTIAVGGATVRNYSLTATASEGDEQYWASSSRSNAPAFSFLMIPDDSVEISGTVTVRLAGGQTTTLSLPPQVVAAAPGGATLSWDLPAPTLGSISGTFGVDSDLVAEHTIYASGPGYASSTVPANGSYHFAALSPGSYGLGARTTFIAPYGVLSHPSQSVLVTDSTNLVRDQTASVALAHGRIEVNAFYTNESISSASFSGAAAGGWSVNDDLTLPAGQLDLVLAAGDWRSRTYRIEVLKDTPATNATFWVTDSSPWVLEAGEEAELPVRSITAVETQIILDVAESSGPEVEIVNARVSGGGRGLSFNAQGPTTSAARPAVRIVAAPGTYSVSAYGRVGSSDVNFADFAFTVPEPASTPEGTDVAVSASPDVSLEYGHVITAGFTTVTQSPIGPQMPEGFQLTVVPPRYYDISTTAVFDGDIKVCFDYVDSDDGSDRDIPPLKEKNLTILHYTNGGWQDLDSTLERDLIENRLCGYTTGFSVFALALFLDEDEDGTWDGADNCPLDANAGQSDADGDGAGDVCDNCPVDANPAQGDADENGIGNACDPVCLTVQRGTSGTTADTSLAAGEPGYSPWAYPYLSTGTYAGGEKISLLSFDLDSVPAGATVESATLTLALQYATASGNIEVHAITAPWSESTVTYASFGGAYEPEVRASFATPAGAAGLRTVDVTGLVQQWVTEELDNHGVVLRDGSAGRLTFRSSEHPDVEQRPRLDLCYLMP